MALTTRLITEIGTRAWLRVFTYSNEAACLASKNGCDAQVRLVDSPRHADWTLGDPKESYPDAMWPTACSTCGRAFSVLSSDVVQRQVHKSRLYDTQSGKPERGDMYWVDWEHWDDEVLAWFDKQKQERACQPTYCTARWTNCDGRHLHVILPDGHEWNASGRASNCDMQDDQEHRCWVLTGTLPKLTASKSGRTCNAGAGSIASPGGWHGFLRDGVLA